MTGPAARSGRDAFSERRKCLQRLLVLPGSLLFHEQSSAGGQLEEPLADSVRSALSSAIANSAPPVPTFATTEARLSYLRWLSAMSDRLYSRVKDFPARALGGRHEYLESSHNPGLMGESSGLHPRQ